MCSRHAGSGLAADGHEICFDMHEFYINCTHVCIHKMSEMQMILRQLQTLQLRFNTLDKHHNLLQQEYLEVHRGLDQTNEIMHRMHARNFSNPTPTTQENTAVPASNTTKVTCDLVYNRTTTRFILPDTQPDTTTPAKMQDH